jgi:hypothetical protein
MKKNMQYASNAISIAPDYSPEDGAATTWRQDVLALKPLMCPLHRIVPKSSLPISAPVAVACPQATSW